MGVLIKGMDMPINCRSCPCSDDESRYCKAVNEYIPMLGKPCFCPLVEIMTPHGRLIDADEVCYQLEKQATIDGQPRAIRRARRIVADAPTIIEVEEE